MNVMGEKRLPVLLHIFIAAFSDHPSRQRDKDGRMAGIERRSLGVEEIYGQVAVRLNVDRLAPLEITLPVAIGKGLGIDAVGVPFLNDDGVPVIRLGLRKKIFHENGLTRSTHAEQDTVLWRSLPKRADSDKIAVGAVIKGLCVSRNPVKLDENGTKSAR